jgi:hypothetical protein
VNLLGPVSLDSGEGGEVVVGAAKERSLLAEPIRSPTPTELLGSTIEIRPHRQQTFQDVPGHWDVFSVDSTQLASARR